MKSIFKLFFLIISFQYVSCSKESKQKFLLEGHILDSHTDLPVSNIEIKYETCEPYGSGGWFVDV